MDFEWAHECGLIPDVRGLSKVARGMELWLAVQKHVMENHFVDYAYKLEDVKCGGDVWYELLEVLNIPRTPLPTSKASNRGTGFLTPPELTWSELQQYSPKLTRNIRELSRELGYDT